MPQKVSSLPWFTSDSCHFFQKSPSKDMPTLATRWFIFTILSTTAPSVFPILVDTVVEDSEEDARFIVKLAEYTSRVGSWFLSMDEDDLEMAFLMDLRRQDNHENFIKRVLSFNELPYAQISNLGKGKQSTFGYSQCLNSVQKAANHSSGE
ncbi:hypothetical protein Tco_0221804 [Tanacetum coccineum]